MATGNGARAVEEPLYRRADPGHFHGMSTPPETEPRDKIETAWTERGHRLVATVWPFSIVLTVQSEIMNLGDGTRSPFGLGTITVLTFTPRGDAERFVEHCLAFFRDDELVKDALSIIRSVHGKLTVPSTPPASMPPQRAGMN
jgi:hypothetical protein